MYLATSFKGLTCHKVKKIGRIRTQSVALCAQRWTFRFISYKRCQNIALIIPVHVQGKFKIKDWRILKTKKKKDERETEWVPLRSENWEENSMGIRVCWVSVRRVVFIGSFVTFGLLRVDSYCWVFVNCTTISLLKPPYFNFSIKSFKTSNTI